MQRARAVAVVASATAVLLGSAACTDDAPDAAAPTSPATGSTAPPTGQATSSTPPATSPPRAPLALAITMHRDPLNVSRREADALIAGRPTTWTGLGQPGGAVRIVRGPAALEKVATDGDALAVVPVTRLDPTVQAVRVKGVDPLIDLDTYPIGAGEQPNVTTMTIVGDIMLGRGVEAAHRGDAGASLDEMSDRLASADLTIGNLESTLSADGVPRQPGDDSFAADPAVLDDLAAAGFDLLSLANNHTGDYGREALLQTLRRVDRSGIQRVGAGRDGDEAWSPTVLEHGGTTFGFLAFNAIGETYRATRNSPGSAEIRMMPRTGPLDQGDLDKMTRAVQRLDHRVDVVIVIPHWGANYVHVAVPDQRKVGRALVDAGADVVAGGHPHYVQGIQPRRDGVIAHSLGNFVFDMDFDEETMEGVMLDLVFWGDRLMAMRPVPLVMSPDFTPRVVGGDRGRAILSDVWAHSDPPYRD